MEEISRNVHIERFEVKAGWEQWILFCSDVHVDSSKHDTELFTAHLKEAQKKDAHIYIWGDYFDLMQGKYDPRSTKHEFGEAIYEKVRKHGIPYIDAVVEHGVDILKPYAKQLRVIGSGNHETNIRKRLETDVLDQLVAFLRREGAQDCFKGGYGGYVKWLFDHEKGGQRNSLTTRYHHGSQGGARTFGTLRVQTDMAQWPSADIYATGHIHHKWYVPQVVEILKKSNQMEEVPRYHICCGSYKNDINDGVGGWAVERGYARTKRGSWWIRLYYDSSARYSRVRAQVIEAD